MVPITTVVACIITLLVSLVLPIVVLIGLAVKNKKQGIVSAWLLGAAGFFVTQILIRLPILTALQSQSWFAVFAKNNPFIYAFGLAFTAGLLVGGAICGSEADGEKFDLEAVSGCRSGPWRHRGNTTHRYDLCKQSDLYRND